MIEGGHAEMKKEYIKPEAEMMKFVEEEEIMLTSNEFASVGLVPDPFSLY